RDGRLGDRAARRPAGRRLGPVAGAVPPADLRGDPALRSGLRRGHGRLRAGVRGPARGRPRAAALLRRATDPQRPLLHLAGHRRPPPHDRLVPPSRRPASTLGPGGAPAAPAAPHLRAGVLRAPQQRRGVRTAPRPRGAGSPVRPVLERATRDAQGGDSGAPWAGAARARSAAGARTAARRTAVRPPRPLASSASQIPRLSTAGYTGHSARCGEAWSRPAFTQETCSNPPAAVRLKGRAETSTVPTRTLRRPNARRAHEVRIRTRRAAARARPGELPRRLDQRAHPAGPAGAARFAARNRR